MQFEKRALYNLLRMNWLRDSSMPAEPWQVEDYRALSGEKLFERLEELDVALTKADFLECAEEVDSPEDLLDSLVDEETEVVLSDQVYLCLFELWRRLLPERVCLSIFCDEVDHQINLYDTDTSVHPDDLQDALANLQVVLDANVDQGGQPQEVFTRVVAGCANEVESFLYDFVAELIDNEGYVYAGELIEGFYAYVEDRSWFDFLRARVVAVTDMKAANRMVTALLKQTLENPDLDLLLEILSFMVLGGEQQLFLKAVSAAAEQITQEEEFKDLLHVCADFHRCLDHDYQERAIEEIIASRAEIDPEEDMQGDDPDKEVLLGILQLSYPPPTNV